METNNKFKLFLPAFSFGTDNKINLISVDLQGEISNVGLFETESGKVMLKKESSYNTKDFSSLSEMVNKFVAENSLQNIEKISVAVPGPVIKGKSAPERLPWKLEAEEIKSHTKIDKVYLINDLEASAYGLGNSCENNIVIIHDSEKASPGNVAVLAPGEGLGEAGLFWDGECLRPFATEGGHCEFSPRTNDEVEFYQFLNKIYGIVSWEKVLSKSGLFNIYRFLRDVKRQKQPDFLTEAIENGNFTEALIEGALDKKDRICTMTIDTFLIFMAREANSLVLKLKATGGLYLSGEIPLMLQKFINREKFYKNFIISDKMEGILKDIPIYLVTDTNTIINGAAVYAAYYHE